MDASVVSRLLAVILVFGLLAGVLWVLRRNRDRYLYGFRSSNPALVMSGELHLGIRQRLVLVHVEGRSLVVAVSPDRIQAVAQWGAPGGKSDEA
jgi:flagellar biogenesis protein FliO